jgi:serine/threonine protein kinase
MQSGHLLRNRYRIECRLSAGGFGETYIAIDEDYPDKRRVVVKHLKPQNTDPAVLEFARRLFANEAVTLAKLGEKTELIPTLYAYFEEDREFYLVQEFIEGQTLTQELGGRRLSEPETIAIIREILVVLSEVHHQRIVHRDLKPDNIIRRSRAGGVSVRENRRLVLIDFGAVKEVRHTSLQTSNLQICRSIGIGTSGYMPSEQAMGYPTAASDIYAVGAIALQCLTGKLPSELFDEDALEFRWQHLCTVSDRLTDTLTKMVAPRQNDRYPNAMATLAAIDLLATPASTTSPVPTGAATETKTSQTPKTPQTSPTYIPPVSSNAKNTHNPPQPPQTSASNKIDRSRLLRWLAIVNVGLGGLFLLSRFFAPSLPKTAAIQPAAVPTTASATQPVATKAIGKEDRTALAGFNRAIELDPKDVGAHIDRGVLKAQKLNDIQGAVADFDRAIQLNSKTAIAYYNRGILKNNYLDDPKGALADYDRAIQINPNYARAYGNRGGLKEDKFKDHQGALADYSRAIQINPKDANAHHNRGTLKANKLNDTQGALADYNRLIQIAPKETNAYNSRGALKANKLNDIQGALADYDRAIQLDSSFTVAYYNRGALRANKLNDAPRALADFNRAIELSPNYADVYNDRGVLKMNKLNDPQGALADFERAIEINPKETNGYMNRGILKYAKLNDLHGAVADYNRVIEIDPNYASAHNNLAFAKYDLGDISGAIESWRKALALNANDADAKLGLAVALYKQGEDVEAFKLGMTAIKLERKSTDLDFLKKERNWSEIILKDATKFLEILNLRAILFPKWQ